ncbi:uncharacterized protein LOC120450200 [Drosophila santomea]|uniref:uncharacterized protein LOC120450200 n=1 Tax=Drosophila santomea TaxID=129105 RepID=UPI00195338B1|nr:uncharacterized protein LOC120450200 [Drosophila santomea]
MAKIVLSISVSFVCLIIAAVPTNKILMLESQCGNINRSYFSNFTMLVKNSQMNLEFFLLRVLVPGITMDMEFFISMQNSYKFQKIFQYTLDMCNLLAQRRNNMFKKWFATFFNAGNFKKYCPVEPNFYYLKNYNYNTLFIPKFLYAGKYRVKFDMNQIRKIDGIRYFVVGCAFEVEIK